MNRCSCTRAAMSRVRPSLWGRCPDTKHRMSAESWWPSACMRSRTGLRTSSGRGKDHQSSASFRSARTSNGILRIFAGTLLRTLGSSTRAAMSRARPSPRGKCPDTKHRTSAESWRPSACMRSRTGLRTSSGRGKDHRSSASSRSARTSNGTLRIFAGTLLRTLGSTDWTWARAWAPGMPSRPRDRSSPSCRTARRGRDCQRPGKSRRRKAWAGTCR